MNNTLIIPSMKILYGDDYNPASYNHKHIDHTKYQVDVNSSPGGMDVTVDGIPLEAYSPDTQVHVLAEIDLQGAAGGGQTQISPRSNGETYRA
jgi:hypothetical protein